ncbi:MAG: hypothetical protein H6592_15360 [Flavobacteriales bacterium]|nr:hypothetical protein [Flavobacteriales bacterium]
MLARMRLSFMLLFVGNASFASAQSVSGGTSVLQGGNGSGLGVVTDVVGTLAGAGQYVNEDPVARSRDVETRVFAGLDVTLQAARTADRTGKARPTNYPWPGLRFQGGASFTYRDRLMASLAAGWGWNGYMMTLDTMVHSVYHSTKNAELRLAWHTLPRRHAPTQWTFGLGLGMTFQRADDQTTDKDGFLTYTEAQRQQRPYLAPEIGRFSASGKDRFELALRYVAHLDPAPAWTSASSYQGSTATTQASDDHLALVMRYHLGFRKPTDPPLPPAPALDEVAMDTLATFTSKRQRVTLSLWDDAEVDGDTISVLLNGIPVLVAYGLTHEPVKLRLDLGYGYNQLQVIAHNEGRIPPNTARAILRRGKGREQLLLKTGTKHGQMLVILRS